MVSYPIDAVSLDLEKVIRSTGHSPIHGILSDQLSIARFRESYAIDAVLPDSGKAIRSTEYCRIQLSYPTVRVLPDSSQLSDGRNIARFRGSYPIDTVLPDSGKVIRLT
jgi:hypothetical protein